MIYANQLIQLNREDPEKYRSKVYKYVGGADPRTNENKPIKQVICVGGNIWEHPDRVGHRSIAYMASNTQLEEFPQSVTWQEAIQAWANGSAIRVEWNKGVFEEKFRQACYFKLGLIGENDMSKNGIPYAVFQQGKWYIEG